MTENKDTIEALEFARDFMLREVISWRMAEKHMILKGGLTENGISPTCRMRDANDAAKLIEEVLNDKEE